MNDNIVLSVRDIARGYGRRIILSGISFDTARGSVIGITGPNGCGKTTLLSILAGMIKPDNGSISLFGKDPLHDSSVFRNSCGYVPQGNPLISEVSVRDNLSLWSGSDKERVQEIISEFALESMLSLPVKKLSGGMKRRLSIACAMADRQELLLLDEPTSALDLHYKEDIRQILHHYAEGGGTVILTSHDEQELLGCSECYFMMPFEEAKEYGSPQLIRTSAQHAIKAAAGDRKELL